MTDVSKLQQKLDDLIHKSFDSFVSYKKAAKIYDDSKKLLERDLDIKEIKKKIEYYKEKEKELDKKQMLNKNGKSIRRTNHSQIQHGYF